MKKKPLSKVSVPAHSPLLSNSFGALEQKLGPIVYRDIDALVDYKSNPRIHPERQIVQLMASISQFGFALPLLVDELNVLITGHARVAAARRLRMRELPVIVAEHWSKAQVQAYRLADNQLAAVATWDEEMLQAEIASIVDIGEVPIEVLGWSTGEIDVILEGEIAEDVDDADDMPELPVSPVSRPGDLWTMGDHRLLNGSSLEPANWARLMSGKIAVMVFCDPPWNVPINGHVSSTARHLQRHLPPEHDAAPERRCCGHGLHGSQSYCRTDGCRARSRSEASQHVHMEQNQCRHGQPVQVTI
jgi:hypothetical protein